VSRGTFQAAPAEELRQRVGRVLLPLAGQESKRSNIAGELCWVRRGSKKLVSKAELE